MSRPPKWILSLRTNFNAKSSLLMIDVEQMFDGFLASFVFLPFCTGLDTYYVNFLSILAMFSDLVTQDFDLLYGSNH